MLLILHFLWWRVVMMSCHDVTKPDSPISACRWAWELILFSLFLGHWVQKFEWFVYVFASWRHVMTSRQYLSSPYNTYWSCGWTVVRFLSKFYVEMLVLNKSLTLILPAAASMSQHCVMTSRCDDMPSYEIEAILVYLQFSHANWQGSHTYCWIVV